MKTKHYILATLTGAAMLWGGTSAYAQNTAVPDTMAKYILTPKAPDTPRINGAKVFGVRPGSQFLYTIPATGIRPMTFAAKNLPKGLKLDPKTGQITGKVKTPGH